MIIFEVYKIKKMNPYFYLLLTLLLISPIQASFGQDSELDKAILLQFLDANKKARNTSFFSVFDQSKGRSFRLNWSEDKALAEWDGVAISKDKEGVNRVVELNLSQADLSARTILLGQEFCKLDKLTRLNISYAVCDDIQLLGKMPNLKELNLRGTDINDPSFLNELHNLEVLDLSSTQVRDVSFLGRMNHLEHLV